MNAAPSPVQSSKPKWVRIADGARSRCAARGWRRGVDAEMQIAAEIARDPATLKDFIQCARGRRGNDPSALRHRLIAEVRRICPGEVQSLSPWDRFRRFLSRLRSFLTPKPPILHP